ncbi:MAG: rod shape-determining protein [Candidatus Shapirobacteria bacterium]|nr:rod shape-determining protein [Candidatus Shapirobacteria bacterium]
MTKFGLLKNKIKTFFSLFSWEIGVDLGSSNTLIYLKDRGVIIDEPTMLARQKRKRWTGLSAPKSKKSGPIAFGLKAKEMLNREPRQIEVVSPIKNGVISDLEALESLISYYLKLVYEIPSKYPKIFKPKVIVGVPGSINQVQKRAVKSVFLNAGAKEVILLEEVVLAAIGIGLPMNNSSGLVIVDVGGGKTEVSVISMGGVVVGRGIKTAGNDLDNSIINYVKMKYGILIGPNSAERIKMEIGSFSKKNEESKITLVRGRDLETGLPKTVKVSEVEIREAMAMELTKIVKLVSTVLDETPPELMEDILKRGIVLVGNGGKINGLASLIETETKIFTKVMEDAGMMVIKGCGELIQNREILKQVKLVSGLKE